MSYTKQSEDYQSASQSKAKEQYINQRKVETPYGKGLLLRTRTSDSNNVTSASIHEIQLSSWKLSDNTHPKLYTCSNPPSIRPKKGDDVICTHGRGIVLSSSSSNEDDNDNNDSPDMYHVEFTSWTLNGRNVVHGYMHISSLSVVRPKEVHEMKPYERVLYSYDQKRQATTHFSKKKYVQALASYTKAVNSLRYLEYDNSCDNDLRCDLVELMITCSNNAATCSIKLDDYTTANKFAMNALVLLDALYTKRGLKIHTSLLSKGITDVKLFGEWKCKSMLFCAKYDAFKEEYDDALKKTKLVKSIITSFKEEKENENKVLLNLEKEVNRFMSTVLKKKKEVLKKEKARAQAMFGNFNKEENEKKEVVVPENTKEMSQTDMNSSSTSANDNTPGVPSTTPKIAKLNGIMNDTNKNDSRMKNTKSVSFPDLDDYEEEEPWYAQHKEAFILTGLSCLSLAGFMFLRGSKR